MPQKTDRTIPHLNSKPIDFGERKFDMPEKHKRQKREKWMKSPYLLTITFCVGMASNALLFFFFIAQSLFGTMLAGFLTGVLFMLTLLAGSLKDED